MIKKLVVNGISLAYEWDNSVDREFNVALLNGGLGTLSDWYFLKSSFEQNNCNTLLHDFRGQMESGVPQGPYHFEQLADDFIALLDHLHIQEIVIIGVSFGGGVAQYLALHHPTRVKGMVLISPISDIGETQEAFLNWLIENAGKYDTRAYFGGMAEQACCPENYEKNREIFEKMAINMPKKPERYFHGQIELAKLAIRECNFMQYASNISAKTIVIGGENDQIIPISQCECLAKKIPNAQFLPIPGVGHLSFLENPSAIVNAINHFITDVYP